MAEPKGLIDRGFSRLADDKDENPPTCFGELESVFPMGEDGLRASPQNCLACVHKTPCLRSGMAKREGLKVREEVVDRAYDSGMIGFLGRWSRKKDLRRRIKRG